MRGIDSALWGFLDCKDSILSCCVVSQQLCVSLRPVDNQMLKGNFLVGVNMGGEYCWPDAILLPVSVSKHRKLHKHRSCFDVSVTVCRTRFAVQYMYECVMRFKMFKKFCFAHGIYEACLSLSVTLQICFPHFDSAGAEQTG